jgi:hypothetical protein
LKIVAEGNEVRRIPTEMIWGMVAVSVVSLLREDTNVHKFEQ